ncbi:MAG: hypothetical protein A3G25_03850 [Betaproteobacteria bacterium RIFCSPLOWO2_12_FULL_63_13]|nr:MAG: hypothetical protein A3G25_03850 [Betaproteobacteria bacterium RIFCSPLOWO2_12_FULL_63_13]
MEVRARRQSTFSIIAQLGNPVFIALSIVLPNAALAIAMALGSLALLNYVHVMTGALWTGIDLFMGFALGPILGAMEPRQRAEVFKRLIPKMTFLMPMLAGATIMAGIHLAQQTGRLSLDDPWIVAALIITAILVAQGFGVLLPNEIRIFKQLVSPTPDIDRIAKLGMQNARLAGIQGLLQLAIIFVMANLRF